MKKIYRNTIVANLRKIEKSCGDMKPLRVGLLPCKANPCSIWISPMWFNFSSVEEFNKVVNEYTYYNCNNEVGRYPHFYIEL